LKIPKNIILLFQPAHAPETNPIERVWQLPKDFEQLRLLIPERLEVMTQEVIASIVGWDYILEALSVAGI
ncbi:MAG: IS630 family transposase, partial [Pseudanabaenaceae cyanobacterium bins.68]|nr:IS630 family transposase [Pseudanabaenaceae cyanobacterium bins.68]